MSNPALVFRFGCHTCGAELDDDRWSLSCQCARCEMLERRKHTDELFRKLLAEMATVAPASAANNIKPLATKFVFGRRFGG